MGRLPAHLKNYCYILPGCFTLANPLTNFSSVCPRGKETRRLKYAAKTWRIKQGAPNSDKQGTRKRENAKFAKKGDNSPLSQNPTLYRKKEAPNGMWVQRYSAD